MCYYCSWKGRCDHIINHMIQNHPTEKLSIRLHELDAATGKRKLKSIHFSTDVVALKQKIDSGYNVHINTDTIKIEYERTSGKTSCEKQTTKTSVETNTEYENVYQDFQGVMDKMKEIGRFDDFCSLLRNIRGGSLDDSIALHLLLDIGQFYRQSTVYSMRYSDESLSFWVTVAKLFKGKGISFFRGFKGEGMQMNRNLTPLECRINFAVPSDPIINREMKQFLLNVEKPGIIDISLDAFASAHGGKDVKLSLDGKKVATGFRDEHGDENLCGHEARPTLQERQSQHKEEITVLEKASEELKNAIADGKEYIPSAETTKNALLVSISNMSNRVRELWQFIVKRQRWLDSLLKQVGDAQDWRKSHLAGSISFWQTKIIHSHATIEELLGCIDQLGYAVACLNGTSSCFVLGKGTVCLEKQSNYVCLKDLDKDKVSNSESTFMKQRSEAWHNLRQNCRISGSTIFNGIGLRTLKDQQAHFDKVFAGKESEKSQELIELLYYGTKHEIDALGTFVGKILPVYYPGLLFREDGCEILKVGDGYAVISGDGSGVNLEGDIDVAVEFKCPKPGKTHTTDQHYSLPVYYSTQVLSQMHAKSCQGSAYLCFTPESSTFLSGAFNDGIWEKVWDYATTLYGQEKTDRPKKRDPYQNELLQDLKCYSNSFDFNAEFPSLKCIPCSCTAANDISDVYGKHGDESVNKEIPLTALATSLDKSLSAIREAYHILRRAAKEVLVTVVSDLDRMGSEDKTCNSVPIQYGFSGFSLSMTSVRGFLGDAISACEDKGLSVKVLAFDGQFAELAVKDEAGRPLTILRFMKQFWEETQKKDRKDKISGLLSYHTSDRDIAVTRHGSSIYVNCRKWDPVKSAFNITKAIMKPQRTKTLETRVNNEHASTEEEFGLTSSLEGCECAFIEEDMDNNMGLAQTSNETDNAVIDDNIEEKSSENVPDMRTEGFELALVSLLAMKEDSKWQTTSIEEFTKCFISATDINKSFNLNELKVLAELNDIQGYRVKRKPELVNILSAKYGDGSRLEVRGKPKSLRDIATSSIKAWNINAINVAYAQLTFDDALAEWENDNPFRGPCNLVTEAGDEVVIHRWYAQPMRMNQNLVQPIIDPHHIFVNNRALCCSKGMKGMGIFPDAWWKVARHSSQNGSELSTEIACDLQDRQSNAFAQKTFSEKVEQVMTENGDSKEARWCDLMRNWYMAIDTASVPLKSRIDSFLAMRSHLLDLLQVGNFPPPGSFVKGMSWVQFEGILTNIDRRLQLYAIAKDGTYNQRAITSLDSETFFSGFQVKLYMCIVA